MPTLRVQRWRLGLLVLCGVAVFLYTLISSEQSRRRGDESLSQRVLMRKTYIHATSKNIPSKVLKEFKDTITSPSISLHDSRCSEGPRDQNAELSDDKITVRFEQRQHLLQSACDRYATSSSFRRLKMERLNLPFYRQIMKDTVSFCPIPKVASSTWWSIFNAIRKAMTSRGIFGINAIKRSSEKDVLFVFVREPYGRLLSAYVDKLFSPNTYFWNSTGRYIVDNFRANASEKSRRCGHDVTFSEFVQFFIHMQLTGERRNGHFVPAHDHCELCQHPYRYIGHLETFTQDMNHILKSVRAPVTYDKSYENSTIHSDADMVLNTMRTEVESCMGLDEACRRLWKKWQIRGLISKALLFPLTREQTHDISLSDFVRIATLAANADDFCPGHEQREEACREAFSGVSVRDVEEVRRLLWLDFELFGYKAEPESVFPKTPYKPDTHFSYFDLYS